MGLFFSKPLQARVGTPGSWVLAEGSDSKEIGWNLGSRLAARFVGSMSVRNA